ncbi:MAG: AFG1/ZapE family ATPase, partial [Woeseiaceae bacterium]|nr:AFG1/ZapE family ATPase [Woeseiaceae bacterium]
MDIRQAYKDSLAREGHVRDPAQIELIDRLEILQRRLEVQKPQRNGLLRFLSRHSQADQRGINGLYIWGGVGRGKTFMMDLFFDSLSVKRKKRIH